MMKKLKKKQETKNVINGMPSPPPPAATTDNDEIGLAGHISASKPKKTAKLTHSPTPTYENDRKDCLSLNRAGIND